MPHLSDLEGENLDLRSTLQKFVDNAKSALVASPTVSALQLASQPLHQLFHDERIRLSEMLL